MSRYGEALRSLVNISGVKLSVIAKEVGYDLSYISKWCNKDKLPAVGVAPEINYSIGRLVADELSSIGAEKSFYDLIEDPGRFPGKTSPKKKKDVLKDMLQKDITAFLNKAFDESKQEAEKKHSSHLAFGETIIRTSEITDFFNRRLPETILKEGANLSSQETGDDQNSIEVLCTLDICKFLNLSNFDVFVSEMPTFDIHVRMGMNMDKFMENPSENLKNLYYFINAKEYISFDFYNDSLLKNLNVIVIKNLIAILCSLDQYGHIITISVIRNPDEVNQIYERVLPSFRATDLLIHHASPGKMNQYGYRTGFYALSGYQIFQPHGFEFLLPEECWPNIAKVYKKIDPSGAAVKSAEQLHITWQESFEKGVIDFFVTKTSLMKYMEDGEIVFSDVIYKMTPEERKLHIQNALALSADNPEIKFHVINDDDLPSVQHLFKMAVYSNGKKMFLKCPRRHHGSTGPWLYSVVSDEIIQATTSLLNEITKAPYCYEYDGASLEEFMDKYGSMVMRIIDL